MVFKRGIVTLFYCAIIFGCAFLLDYTTVPSEIYAKETDSKIKTVTISAVGDCTLGVDSRYNNFFNNYYNRHDNKYFFKRVKNIFEKDDITLVNFEGTLTSSTKRNIKKFTFKGPGKYAKILKEGKIEVVNLANNHSHDYKEKGYKDTKANLEKENIDFCVNSKIAYKEVNGIKVAFLGFSEYTGSQKKDIKEGIKKAKKAKSQIIIVSFHWGQEGHHEANNSQKNLGKYAIDNGASLVVGHHPHVLQGIEEYNGRYILYSLGNFCFGGNSNPKDKDTMIFQQKFYIKNGKLELKQNAKVIPCSVSGKTYTNNFQPRVLKGKEGKRVISKLNSYSKGMKIKIHSNGNIKKTH